MLPTIVRRAAAPPKIPFNIYANPYKAKRTWPPDFSKLSPKHQFRLERRYRRRAKLKWARPTWTKAVKLAQWGSGIFVVVYSVLFYDWGKSEEEVPFKGVREWYKGLVHSIWTQNSHTIRRPEPRTTSPDPPASPQP